MVAPTRTYLIHRYWLDGLSIKKIAARHNDISADLPANCGGTFWLYVALVELGHIKSPTAGEIRAMRSWRVLRDELEWLAREVRG